MKLASFLAGAGAALMLGLAAPMSWGQATEPGLVATPYVAPAATSPTVPPERVAPGVPGIPPNTQKPAGPAPIKSHQAEINGDYVAKKIADAGARGKDIAAAKSQQKMGDAALQDGKDDQAARHYESALRLIGAMPVGFGEDQAGSLEH